MSFPEENENKVLNIYSNFQMKTYCEWVLLTVYWYLYRDIKESGRLSHNI